MVGGCTMDGIYRATDDFEHRNLQLGIVEVAAEHPVRSAGSDRRHRRGADLGAMADLGRPVRDLPGADPVQRAQLCAAQAAARQYVGCAETDRTVTLIVVAA